LVSWNQVEYYRVSREVRRALYPGIPSWWFAVKVPANMFVPLPAVLEYRGIALVRHYALHWAVSKTEWAVATFGRWVPDLLLRGVMWLIPSRLRRWWDVLGIGALLRGSEYALGDVQAGLYFHDRHYWIGGEEIGPKRGKIHGEWGILVERRGEHYTVVPSRPSNRTMAQTADVEAEQRAPRNVGDRNIHEQPHNTLVAEADC
jgi:hypothetical protein